MEPRRLYRSLTDRKIGGVAGGMGEYFRTDPLLIRLIFVVLALAGGGGVLIYLVFWIVTPEKTQFTYNSADYNQNGPDSNETGTPEQGTEQVNNEPDVSVNPNNHQTTERKKGSLIGGLVLITIGCLFFADQLIPEVNFRDLWPLILVAVGTGLLINAFSHRNNSRNRQN